MVLLVEVLLHRFKIFKSYFVTGLTPLAALCLGETLSDDVDPGESFRYSYLMKLL